MSDTLKAVASFSEAGWKPMPRAYDRDIESDVWQAWRDSEGHPFVISDLARPTIEWQRVDADTVAYRIDGDVLLVIAYSYDAELRGEDWHSTLTIDSWHMGTEAAQ